MCEKYIQKASILCTLPKEKRKKEKMRRRDDKGDEYLSELLFHYF